jgi:hypothetical protein
VDRLWGRTGKGKVSEASVLRIVTPAELKRLNGSRPKMGGEAGSGHGKRTSSAVKTEELHEVEN